MNMYLQKIVLALNFFLLIGLLSLYAREKPIIDMTPEQEHRVPYANCYIVTGNLQKCIEDSKK